MCEVFLRKVFLTEKCPRESFVYPVQKHLPHTHTHTHPSLSPSMSFAPSLLSPLYLLQGTQRHISLGRTRQAIPACLKNQPTCTFLTFSACCLHTRLSSLLTSSRLPAPGMNSSSHLHYIHIPHFLCLQSRTVIHSHSTQILLSGGFLPFSDPPAVHRCASFCSTAV